MAVGLNDLAHGHGIVYAVADAGVSAGGAAGGGLVGAAYCGGPLDPIDGGCALVGAIIGGNLAPVALNAVIDLWKKAF